MLSELVVFSFYEATELFRLFSTARWQAHFSVSEAVVLRSHLWHSEQQNTGSAAPETQSISVKTEVEGGGRGAKFIFHAVRLFG